MGRIQHDFIAMQQSTATHGTEFSAQNMAQGWVAFPALSMVNDRIGNNDTASRQARFKPGGQSERQ